MPHSLQHILVIEDEPKVAQSLQQGLNEADFRTTLANTGEEGLVHFLEDKPDIIILDLNLPGRDGIEILHTLRQHDNQIPVIILSARDTIEDRVSGLDIGADDYLVKPFAFAELLARLRVILRRDNSPKENTLSETNSAGTMLTIADLSIDLLKRKVIRENKNINVTPREFEILELFMRNKNTTVSRKTLARDVWHVERATPLDNVIDVHIMRLRKKIDDGYAIKLIQTVRGLGFMLSAEEQK